MKKLWLGILALATVAAFAAPVSAQSEVERLKSELAQLRSEVDTLKTVQHGGQGNAEDPLKVSLKKSIFSWSTEDGKFSLTMSTRVQVRVTYNDERGQDIDGAGDPNNTAGASTNGKDFWNFRIRRAKTEFNGNLFEKEFKYKVVLQWHEGGNDIIEVARFTWAKWKEFNINVGQDKVPYSHQTLVSSGRQQFVERGTVDATFNQSFGKGLWFTGMIGDDAHTWVKYWVGVFNGVQRGNNDFRNNDRAILGDTFGQTVDAELMPVVRVETHPLGNVADDMVDYRTREESKKVLFSVGVGFTWLTSRMNNGALRTVNASPGSGRFDTGEDTIQLTMDGHFRFFGLSVNIEYHHQHTEFHNFGPKEGNRITANRNRPGDVTNNGLNFEVGFFILPQQFDVAIRFGYIDNDEFWMNGSTNHQFGLRPDSTEFGLALGYYIGGHNLKIQADFTYISYQLVTTVGTVPALPTGSSQPTRSASSIANDAADWLNVWQFRVQIQWIF